jgi:hypothetical protein
MSSERAPQPNSPSTPGETDRAPSNPDEEVAPDAMSVYVGPSAIPHSTEHATFELQTVRVAPEADPRRAPTIVRPRAAPLPPLDAGVALRDSWPAPSAGSARFLSLGLVAVLASFALVAGSIAARALLTTAAEPRPATAVDRSPPPPVIDEAPRDRDSQVEAASLAIPPRSLPSATVPSATSEPSAVTRAVPPSSAREAAAALQRFEVSAPLESPGATRAAAPATVTAPRPSSSPVSASPTAARSPRRIF